MGRTKSYLYVIGVGNGFDREVKIGRSVDPSKRRSQLQSNGRGKLVVYGKWLVAYDDAPYLEAVCHEALRPLRLHGEMFEAPAYLACEIVAQIAAHGELDEFCRAVIASEVASQAWTRASDVGSHRGRWAKSDAVARFEALEAEMKSADRLVVKIDRERACRMDPMIKALMDFGTYDDLEASA